MKIGQETRIKNLQQFKKRMVGSKTKTTLGVLCGNPQTSQKKTSSVSGQSQKVFGMEGEHLPAIFIAQSSVRGMT